MVCVLGGGVRGVRGWRASVEEGDESIVNALLYSCVLGNGTEFCVALFDPYARVCVCECVARTLYGDMHTHL